MKQIIIAAAILMILVWNLADNGGSLAPMIHKKTYTDYEKIDKPEVAKERADWRLAQRDGQVASMTQLIESKKIIKKNFKKQLAKSDKKSAGINGWTELGPEGIGGRIRSIAVHPTNTDIIYIGSVSGGIWKTVNGGSSWNPIDDFMSFLSVTQIIYDPSNSNIMYASTGEGAISGVRAGGIFKSTNGGFNWTQLTIPTDRSRYVNDIVVDFNNSNNVFAVTNDTGLGNVIRSTDAGENWEIIEADIPRPLDIKINPNNSEQIFVGTRTTGSTPANLLVCNNALDIVPRFDVINQIGGTSSGRTEIAIAEINPNWVYVLADNNNSPEIWLCNDGTGLNWTRQFSNTSSTTTMNLFGDNAQGWYDNVIYVDRYDVNRVVVGGLNLWRSNDQGRTFTRISNLSDDINGSDNGENNSVHADQHVIMTHPDHTNSSGNRIVLIGNDGGIYKTNDIRTVSENSGWEELNSNLAITQYNGAAASPDGTCVIGGSQDNSFSFSTDVGLNWNQPVNGDGARAAINYNNPFVFFANNNNNSIFRSRDAGATWNRSTRFNSSDCANVNGCTDDDKELFSVNDNAPLFSVFVMDPNDPDILLAGAERLWHNDRASEDDFYLNWSSIKNVVSTGTVVSAIDIAKGDSDLIWVGYDDGTIQKTTNGGISWSTDIRPLGGNGSFVTDIAISPVNNDYVAVTLGGYDQEHIWVSNDGGNSWADRDLGFHMQVNTVSWYPDRIGWLYVGTDFGIFASENFGRDWSVKPLFANDKDYLNNEGPSYVEISELFWQGKILYASTYGRGMWKSSTGVYDKIFVDRDAPGPTENGSFIYPFNTFKEALDVAGDGTEIIFFSDGVHDEFPPTEIIDKNVEISLFNTNPGPVIIK